VQAKERKEDTVGNTKYVRRRGKEVGAWRRVQNKKKTRGNWRMDEGKREELHGHCKKGGSPERRKTTCSTMLWGYSHFWRKSQKKIDSSTRVCRTVMADTPLCSYNVTSASRSPFHCAKMAASTFRGQKDQKDFKVSIYGFPFNFPRLIFLCSRNKVTSDPGLFSSPFIVMSLIACRAALRLLASAPLPRIPLPWAPASRLVTK
jgi:hypothetical protein